MARQHAQLEDRLRSKTDEIAKIKTQKRDLEKTVEGLRSTSRRINRLTLEISTMKSEKVRLQRFIEQSQREHRAQLEEKQRAIQSLQKQTRAQTKQISELQRDNKRADSLLRSQVEQTTQLRRQLKDLKLAADVQRREHERYSKEDQKRVRWLERQLELQGRKDVQIRKLEQKLEQKETALLRLKEMLRQQEAQKKRSRQGARSEAGGLERLEQEELEDAIEQAQVDLSEKVESLQDVEQAMEKTSFSEEDVLRQLRALRPEEAMEMLCVCYKKICDYVSELRDMQMAVGAKRGKIGSWAGKKRPSRSCRRS